MTDYKELAEDLQYCGGTGLCAGCRRNPKGENIPRCNILLDAAQAIEELEKLLPRMEGQS